MPFTRPAADELRSAVILSAPHLASEPIDYLGEGWDFWVFSLADSVLRVPKDDGYAARLVHEARLLAELAPTLPLPIPVPQHHFEDGPNALPFVAYRRVPGVSLVDLERPPAPDFGASLGRFLKAMHAFPVERAAVLGLEVFDCVRARHRRIEICEGFIRKVFPLFSCEARTYVEHVFEAHLNDPYEFDFEPSFSHGDIDDRNVLANSETGELSGVVDFSDADVHNPAGDFAWAYGGGFARLGIADQIPDLLREGAIEAKRLRGRVDFTPVWFALHDVEHGLDIGDDGFVEEGILALNRVVPFGLQCA